MCIFFIAYHGFKVCTHFYLQFLDSQQICIHIVCIFVKLFTHYFKYLPNLCYGSVCTFQLLVYTIKLPMQCHVFVFIVIFLYFIKHQSEHLSLHDPYEVLMCMLQFLWGMARGVPEKFPLFSNPYRYSLFRKFVSENAITVFPSHLNDICSLSSVVVQTHYWMYGHTSQ